MAVQGLRVSAQDAVWASGAAAPLNRILFRANPAPAVPAAQCPWHPAPKRYRSQLEHRCAATCRRALGDAEWRCRGVVVSAAGVKAVDLRCSTTRTFRDPGSRCRESPTARTIKFPPTTP